MIKQLQEEIDYHPMEVPKSERKNEFTK